MKTYTFCSKCGGYIGMPSPESFYWICGNKMKTNFLKPLGQSFDSLLEATSDFVNHAASQANDFLAGVVSPQSTNNFSETDTSITLSMALPGVLKNEIEISHSENVLTIKLTRNVSAVKVGPTDFEKDYDTSGLNMDTIQSKLENGILRVEIQKLVTEKPKTERKVVPIL